MINKEIKKKNQNELARIQKQNEAAKKALQQQKASQKSSATFIKEIEDNKNALQKIRTTAAEKIYNANEKVQAAADEKIEKIENEKFKNLISLADASKLFGKDESTLRKNIKNGKFIEWRDCVKYGKSWVFDYEALERVYGQVE